MKKVFYDKLYDSETAVYMGEWSTKCQESPDSFIETLYRKRTGEFFLHGEGGAKSIYASDYGGGLRGAGEQIIPLTDTEARKWVSEHLSADEYQAIFGFVAEDGSQSTITFSLATDVMERGMQAAMQRGISFPALIHELISRNT